MKWHFLGHLGKLLFSSGKDALTFPALSPIERDSPGRRDEGQDHWGAAGRRGWLWGVQLEGDLRNTSVVMENFPLSQKRRKLGDRQEEGVKFRAVMGCKLQTPLLCWPAHLVWVTFPCMGGISPTSLQLPRRAELLAFGGWGVCVSCKGRSGTSTGGSDASNSGGSCAAGVWELR